MKRILGLDLGTNSIGWALIDSDFTIESIGTQIFPISNFGQTQHPSELFFHNLVKG